MFRISIQNGMNYAVKIPSVPEAADDIQTLCQNSDDCILICSSLESLKHTVLNGETIKVVGDGPEDREYVVGEE